MYLGGGTAAAKKGEEVVKDGVEEPLEKGQSGGDQGQVL